MSDTTLAPADPNTVAAMFTFLDATIEKGWLNASTAKSFKTAATQILDIDSGWEALDIRSLDVEDFYSRFRVLKSNEYSDDTMRIYKSRLNKAIKMYTARLDGEDWKAYAPNARSTSGPRAKANASAKKAAPAKERRASVDPGLTDDVVVVAATSSVPLVRYPFPLRDNVDVSLSLPRDLTKEEAVRLANFIGSLARVERSDHKALTAS